MSKTKFFHISTKELFSIPKILFLKIMETELTFDSFLILIFFEKEFSYFFIHNLF